MLGPLRFRVPRRVPSALFALQWLRARGGGLARSGRIVMGLLLGKAEGTGLSERAIVYHRQFGLERIRT